MAVQNLLICALSVAAQRWRQRAEMMNVHLDLANTPAIFPPIRVHGPGSSDSCSAICKWCLLARLPVS